MKFVVSSERLLVAYKKRAQAFVRPREEAGAKMEKALRDYRETTGFWWWKKSTPLSQKQLGHLLADAGNHKNWHYPNGADEFRSKFRWYKNAIERSMELALTTEIASRIGVKTIELDLEEFNAIKDHF